MCVAVVVAIAIKLLFASMEKVDIAVVIDV
jgi:hypothetical protein